MLAVLPAQPQKMEESATLRQTLAVLREVAGNAEPTRKAPVRRYHLVRVVQYSGVRTAIPGGSLDGALTHQCVITSMTIAQEDSPGLFRSSTLTNISSVNAKFVRNCCPGASATPALVVALN